MLPRLAVPRLAPTDRLASLPAAALRDARSGLPPRLSTRVRVGLRGADLCVRFDGRDDGVVAAFTGRDDPLWKEDVYEVFVGPAADPTSYFEIEVNPLGAVFDARVRSPGLSRARMQVDPAWDCAGLETRVRRSEGRWSAYLRIPLAALGAGPDTPALRANFYRIDRGRPDEFSAWSPTFADPPDFHVPEMFGTLDLRV